VKSRFLLFLGLFALVAQAEPPPVYCLQYPKRVFGGAAVDLSPLFKWWVEEPSPQRNTNIVTGQEARSPRPLPAWVRIIGREFKIAGSGWVVTGAVESSPDQKQGGRFFVRHFPAKEKESFEVAQARLVQIIAYQSGQYSLSSYEEAQGQGFGANRDIANIANGPGSQRAWQYNVAASQAFNRSQFAAQNAASVQAERVVLESYVNKFPASTNYILDFFALRTGETYQGLPVYDIGQTFGVRK